MIDWSFIARFEGDSLVGYVPRDALGAVEGHSGVTIGMGVDLGQDHHLGYVDTHVADPALAAKLDPYLGVTGEPAARLLAARPLTITSEQRAVLNAGVQAAHAATLRIAYNRRALRGWDALTDAQQTVLASVCWQYGDVPDRCPKFWAACVGARWADAVAELRDFGDRYPTRRRAEADYLEGITA